MSKSYTRKVLFVIDGMNVGGTQEHIYNFVLQFPEYHVTIISLYGENFYKSRLDALDNVSVVHICKAKGTDRKRLMFYAPYVALKFLLMRKQLIGQFDFVDLRLPFALLLWTIAGLYRSTPCYYSVDCDVRQLTWYERLVFKHCLPKIPRVGLDPILRSGYSYINFRSGQLVPGGVFVTHRRSSNPREYIYSRNLIFIGRLVPYKDPLTAIRIVQLVNNIGPDQVGLHVIGDGPLRRELEEYCSIAKLDYVHFYGNQSNIQDFIPNADGLIKTSIGEPVNSVVREMLLAGKIVFSTVESDADTQYVEMGLIHEVLRDVLDGSALNIIEVLKQGGKSTDLSAAANTLFENCTVISFYKAMIEIKSD